MATFEVVDPATGRAFALCPDASRADLDAAVAAARRAFPAWAALGLRGDGATLIFALADRITAAADELAPLLTREHGKPLEQARMELSVSGHHMKQLASLDLPDEVLRDDERGRVELRYHPLGVVGAIAPWNFPVAPGHAQGRAGALHRQYPGAEAVALHAADHAGGGAAGRGRPPAGRAQRRRRRQRSRRLDDRRIRISTRSASPARSRPARRCWPARPAPSSA